MIERKEYLEKLKNFKDKDLIKVITGIRRCGKSTLFDLFINYLKEIGISDKQIIKINLEDVDYNFKDYKELYDYINKKIDSKQQYYVFLDEVQNVPLFQKAVDSLYIKKNVDLYITGSNANLLSSELATLLSGRYIEIKMLPLSFKEYKGVYKELTNDELYQKYISIGSLPYTTSLDSEDDVSIYLSSVYNDIIIKDVMTRKKISDESMLKSVANYAMDNIGNLVSSNNIANIMISDGREINVRTVEKYLEGCIESIIKQTLKNIEIILVDDGSTDNSLKILKKYQSLDNRIKILYQKNQGAGVARNAGMEVAVGEYLMFLDSLQKICHSIPNLTSC